MARIKFGMMMTDARGKLGGHVFTKTRSGATIRTKVTPTNPQTSAQGTVRGLFGNLSRFWALLTLSEQLSWNGVVGEYKKTNAFGDQYQPSGKNLFQMVNTNLNTVGAPQTNTPPAGRGVLAFDNLTVEFLPSASQLILSVHLLDTPGASDFIVIEATAPMSTGRFNFSGSYRQISVSPAGNIPDDTVLFNLYTAKFGTPLAGRKVSFRVYTISSASGIASPRQTADALT